MLILALADRPPAPDPAVMVAQRRVDAVLCLGDLDRAWIESLETVPVPVLGVHGNHDEPGLLGELGIDDLHLRRTTLRGRTVAGFEGCVKYGAGGHHQYTQKESCKLARRLPAAEILLCHCPPLGVNDDPDDPSHIGFEGLRRWVDKHHPRHILHGHVHPQHGEVVTRYGESQVHWIRGQKVLRLT